MLHSSNQLPLLLIVLVVVITLCVLCPRPQSPFSQLPWIERDDVALPVQSLRYERKRDDKCDDDFYINYYDTIFGAKLDSCSKALASIVNSQSIVLDAACRTGRVLSHPTFQKAQYSFGMDVSPRMVERARTSTNGYDVKEWLHDDYRVSSSHFLPS